MFIGFAAPITVWFIFSGEFGDFEVPILVELVLSVLSRVYLLLND